MRKVPRSDARRFMILLIGRAPIPEALVVNDSGHHSPWSADVCSFLNGCLLSAAKSGRSITVHHANWADQS